MSKKLTYRSLHLRAAPDGTPETLDIENRSVEVIGATESPVNVYDREQGRVVPEVLLMSGCRLPKSKQVPLLDSHDNWDTRSVLGSYREMGFNGPLLVGRAFYSEAPEADGAWLKTTEGHLTDYSVGYRVFKSEWIPEGDTRAVMGTEYSGPVRVSTGWEVKELSVCPIGADELAKARSYKDEKKKEIKKMDTKLRKYLEDNGLKMDATEDEANDFLRTFEWPERVEADSNTDGDGTNTDATRADTITAAITDERNRVTEIRAMCRKFELDDKADGLINSGVALDKARKTIIDAVSTRDVDVDHQSAELVADSIDKFRAAGVDSLLLRSGETVEKAAPGADDLRGFSLRELARESLRIGGHKTTGNPLEMIGRAMTVDDFPYILANVANKSLFIGYDDSTETWQEWCSTGSVPDFKTQSFPRISEASDLDEIPEDTEYKYGTRTEARETYNIVTYGKMFAISRQAIINDDLGAFTTIPQAHGEAAARKIGDIAYAVLTANAAMGDGVALFHNASHSNLATGGLAAPGVANIAAAILAMKTQTDLQGLKKLNIRPEYLIAPAALEGSTEVFLRSDRFVDSDTIATDSSLAATRVNPYSGSYFTRVYEARLDDNSATAWYLAGRKGKTVMVGFLNGQQAPYLESKQGWNVDGIEYKVRIDAGALALDYRTLYKNNGA